MCRFLLKAPCFSSPVLFSSALVLRSSLFSVLLLLACTAAVHAEDNVVAAAPGETLRDPTKPLGHRVAPQGQHNSAYNLNSVLISAQRKQAVINGVTLREGQVIPDSGGVIVKRISPQTVVVQQGAKTWALRLAPSVVIRH